MDDLTTEPQQSLQSSEALMAEVFKVFDKNNQELNLIECLMVVMEEHLLTEEDVASILDKTAKSILKSNAHDAGIFRKQFYDPGFLF